MQMMKDRTNELIQRLRFVFHLVEDKKIDYETAENLVNEELPCKDQEEKHSLDLIPLYKKAIANQSLVTINEKNFKYECLKLLIANSALSNAYWQAIKSLISYSLSVVVASICVFSIVGLRLLKEFTEIYLSSEYATPEVTRWVVSWGNYYWLAIVAVVLLTVSIMFLAQYFNRQLAKMAPLNQIVRGIIPSSVAYYYHEYLVVQFAKNLSASGISTDVAIEEMKKSVFGSATFKCKSSGSLPSLMVAQKLGVLERELNYQAEQTSENLVAILYKFKKLMNRAVFVIAAIFVGFSLVAVYLPIFHFGQAF